MKITGMRAFWLLAIGQFISLTGSAMTQFALSIWLFQQTGQVTPIGVVGVASALPIFLSPFIGPLVDRWNRKLTMMISDLGAGVVTIALFLLYSTGNLQVWHLAVGAFISSLCGMFQWPAYSAAISVMVSKEQYTRANALQGLAENAATILAPSLAGALLAGLILGGQQLIPAIGVSGIILIDIFTFTAAIGALLLIHVPEPERSAAGEESRRSFRSELTFGFNYILQRPSLLGLQLVFLFGNLFTTIAFTLLTPMILSRSGNSEQTLGLVNSIIGIGGIIGTILLTAHGGPKRRVNGVLGGWILSSLTGFVLFGLGQVALVWGGAALVSNIINPVINSSNQAIWQSKVPPDVQGKVFTIRRFIAWLANPVGAFLAGPLADQVFEPAMRSDGALAPVFGGLIGTGPGAGMALMMVLAGIGAALVAAIAYLVPVVRNAEDLLPDHGAGGA
jgi:MFS transporter, DHA3 family, macrolide efflux protein